MNLLPYTILSSAISLDGFLNDTGDERLLLSHPEDFNRVDEVRASCDGILIGAHTLRLDNPSLKIRSQALRKKRVEEQKPLNPVRITLTSSGNLPGSHAFFADSDNAILVYSPPDTAPKLKERLKYTAATIISLGTTPIDLHSLLIDLKQKGVHKLLIEGGEQIATSFLSAGLINEFQVAIAPFFVGTNRCPQAGRSMHFST